MGSPDGIAVMSGDGRSTRQLCSNHRVSILIDRLPQRMGLLDVSSNPEMVGRRARAGADTGLQIDDLGFVHRAVPEPTLVRRLVQDHRVLHVVSGVGDDGDDGVRAVGEEIEPVLVPQFRSDDRRLTGLESVLKSW